MVSMKSLARSIGPIRRLHDSRNELGAALEAANARLGDAERQIRELTQKLRLRHDSTQRRAVRDSSAPDQIKRVVAHAELMAALHSRHGTMPVYEDVLRNGYQRLISKGDTVIDVGAHVGDHTAEFCKLVGDSGSVIAFEPLPDIFQKLQSNITSSNARLINACLSEEAGRISFVHARGMPSESGMRQRIYNHPDVTQPEIIEVEAVRLDDWINKIKSLRFLKIDVEGGEISVLHGGKKVLSRYRPIVSVEYGFQGYSVYGHEKNTLWNFAVEQDYILGDLFGAPCDDAETWDKICGVSYWDFYMIPREKIGEWQNAVSGI